MSRRPVAIGAIISASIGIVPLQGAETSDRTRDMMAHFERLTAVDADGCLRHRSDVEEDAIVVCGMPADQRRQRLPFPELGKVEGDRKIRGEIPAGDARYVYQSGCGVSQSDRNCFKGLTIVSTAIGAGAKDGASGAGAQLWQSATEQPPPEQLPEVSREAVP